MKKKNYLVGKTKFLKQELVVPKGYRLIKDWELLKLVREGDKELSKLLKKEWVWCMVGKEVRAAGLYCDDGSFLVSSDNYIYDRGRSRGVFIKK